MVALVVMVVSQKVTHSAHFQSCYEIKERRSPHGVPVPVP